MKENDRNKDEIIKTIMERYENSIIELNKYKSICKRLDKKCQELEKENKELKQVNLSHIKLNRELMKDRK